MAPDVARSALFSRDAACVASVAALLFLFQLGVAPLWDRDEPRNAGCAAEMLDAGDWVVPIFNTELRTHKPVLLYWLIMVSYSIFGVNEFGARFMSALLGVGTVLLTWHAARILFNRGVAVWAGLILASTIMFGVASRAATPDGLLIFCGTLAITLFVHFSFGSGDRRLADQQGPTSGDGYFPRPLWQAIAIYSAMGLAVLAKGPVGLVIPTAVIGMYLLIKRLPPSGTPGTWTGRLVSLLRPFHPVHFLSTCRSMRPLVAITTVAIIALPWYFWVALRTDGIWTREFLWTHNVSRATGVMEGHSGPPILFYVGAILFGFFPWSIVTIPCGMHLWTKSRDAARETNNQSSAGQTSTGNTSTRFRDGVILLLCWVGVYIGVFSLAQTKLPSYVTPCYPALAILAAIFIHDWSLATEFRRIWLKVGLANLIAVGALLIVALPIAAHRFLPGSEWLGIVGLVPLVGGIICWRWYSCSEHRKATNALGLTAVAFMLLLMGVLPAELGRHRQYNELFAVISKHDGPIASWGHLEPSWIFYGGRSIRDFEVHQQQEFSDFLAANPTTLVITTPGRIEEEGAEPGTPTSDLFSDYRLVHQTEYFLRNRSLIVIQPQFSEWVARKNDQTSTSEIRRE